MPKIKSVSQKNLKIEGTSKTFGQFVTTTTTKNVVPSKTTIKIPSDADPQKTKTQVVIAAANNKNNSNVTVEQQSEFSDASDLGEGKKITTVMTIAESDILPKEQITKILLESEKIDLLISLKSEDSVPLEYNTLQEPQIEDTKFIYQFWDPNENDLSSQEDPVQDPLLTKTLQQVPRYIEIRWKSSEIIEQITENKVDNTAEAKNLKEKAFRANRGIENFASTMLVRPTNKSLRNLNSLKIGTSSKAKIVDIHEIEKGFESVSNKHEFTNTVHSVINAQNSQITDQKLILNLIGKLVK